MIPERLRPAVLEEAKVAAMSQVERVLSDQDKSTIEKRVRALGDEELGMCAIQKYALLRWHMLFPEDMESAFEAFDSGGYPMLQSYIESRTSVILFVMPEYDDLDTATYLEVAAKQIEGIRFFNLGLHADYVSSSDATSWCQKHKLPRHFVFVMRPEDFANSPVNNRPEIPMESVGGKLKPMEFARRYPRKSPVKAIKVAAPDQETKKRILRTRKP